VLLHPLADTTKHLDPGLEDLLKVHPDIDGDLGDPGGKFFAVAVVEPEDSKGHVLGEGSREHFAVVEPLHVSQGPHQLLCDLPDLGFPGLHRGRGEQIVHQPPVFPMQRRVDLERCKPRERQLRKARSMLRIRESMPITAGSAEILVSGDDPEAAMALAPPDGRLRPQGPEHRPWVGGQRSIEVVVRLGDSWFFIDHGGLLLAAFPRVKAGHDRPSSSTHNQ
jgi:hypothetical protein